LIAITIIVHHDGEALAKQSIALVLMSKFTTAINAQNLTTFTQTN